jgi:phosphoesterase RecJ-like protein
MTIDLSPWSAAVPDALLVRLREASDAVIVSHEHPDADTLGAGIALAAILESRGARVTLLCADPPPPLYAFLPETAGYRGELPDDIQADLVVLVDCGSIDRVGGLGPRFSAVVGTVEQAVIDHHASNGSSGAADWVDPGAAATCEMIALIADRMGVPFSLPGLASALMAGIVMDTATFAHPNATPRTLAVSAALVDAGAPLADISRRLYRSKPDEQLRLFGRVLDRLETAAGGRIVHSSLLDTDLTATGAIAAHSEGIIDLLSQSERAAVAILFKEQGPDSTRVSVRTRPGGLDATALTGLFGGGGHARAAGATLAEPLVAARRRFLEAAERLLDQAAH